MGKTKFQIKIIFKEAKMITNVNIKEANLNNIETVVHANITSDTTFNDDIIQC